MKKEFDEIELAKRICDDYKFIDNDLVKSYRKITSGYHQNLLNSIKLLQENQVLAEIVNNLDILIFVIDENFKNILYINNYTKNIVFLSNNYSMDNIDNEFKNKILEGYADGHNSELNVDIRFIESNTWFSTKSYKVNWIDGKIAYLQVGMDITDSKIKEEELQNHAYTDPLTGISNRRTGLLLLEKEIKSAARSNKSLTICFMDIDDLKIINDVLGHSEGDFLIKSFANIIKSNIRSNDTLCRIGGDEFMLILPDCSKACAMLKMIQIHDKIDLFNNVMKKPYGLSFSTGIEEISRDNKLRIDEIMERVDKKMYIDKINRRSSKKA